MDKQKDFCRVCLRSRSNISTIFHYRGEKYLPSVIYNISGVKISSRHEPDAQICSVCAAAIIAAERIILQCQETEEFLLSERKNETRSSTEAMGYDERETDASKLSSKMSINLESHTSELSDDDSILASSVNNASTLTYDDNNTFIKQESNEQCEDADFMSDNSCTNFPEPEFIMEDNSSNPIIPSTQKSKPVAEIKPKFKDIPSASESNFNSNDEKQQPYLHKCEFCEFETVVRKSFIKHLLENHDIDDTNIYPCTLCTQKFSWRRLLFRHLEEDHRQHPAEKKYMCDECGKAYTHEIYLTNHRKTQHEAECHKCPFPGCDSKFNRVFSLRRHFNNMHSTLKRYYCETCDKHFSVWDSWKYHMDVVHQNTKITCPKCFSPFRNQKHLQKHMLIDSCRNWLFHCGYCKRRFPTQSGWKLHEKSMHLQEAQLGKEPLCVI